MIVLFYHDTADVRRDSNTVNCSHKSGSGNFLHQNISFTGFSLGILLETCLSRVKHKTMDTFLIFLPSSHSRLFDGSHSRTLLVNCDLSGQ